MMKFRYKLYIYFFFTVGLFSFSFVHIRAQDDRDLLKAGLYQQGIYLDTIPPEVVVFKPSEYLIGVKYTYAITNIDVTPDVHPRKVNTPLNLSLLYTYYHSLWGYMNYFGLQTGITYGSQGFTSEYNLGNMDQTITYLQIPVMSAFKIDAGKHFRILFSVGGFGGYRLTTDKPGGFDCFDNRWDYGIIGSAGLAIRLHPFEFHLEGGYQYHFSQLFHQEKLSSTWWLYTYPNQINFSFGIHINL